MISTGEEVCWTNEDLSIVDITDSLQMAPVQDWLNVASQSLTRSQLGLKCIIKSPNLFNLPSGHPDGSTMESIRTD
jgi:hypothetical protein